LYEYLASHYRVGMTLRWQMSSLCLNVSVCHHYTLASVLLQGPHKENVNTTQWSVNMSHTKHKRIYV